MIENTCRRRGRCRPGLVAGLLARTLLACGAVAWAAVDGAAPPLRLPPVANQSGFAGLVAKVKPAIVNIAVVETVVEKGQEINGRQLQSLLPRGTPFSDMMRNFLQQQRAEPVQGLGSGFIIDPAGYIVTNNHVTKDASKITVTMDGGQSYPAKVVGRECQARSCPAQNRRRQAAALRRLRRFLKRVGRRLGGRSGAILTVSAAPSQRGSCRHITATSTKASMTITCRSTHRSIPATRVAPCSTRRVRSLGSTQRSTRQAAGSVGIGFAIPSIVASKVVAQLREHGKVDRGWLGVQMQELTPALANAVGRPNTEGVIVDEVEPNSPASRADLQQGDIITAFDGTTVKSPQHLAIAVANAQTIQPPS
jgi:serine protease Do